MANKDFLDYWETITNVGLSVAKYKSSKAEAQANREMKLQIEDERIARENYRADLAIKKEYVKDAYEDNQASIKQSINELDTYTLNAAQLVKLSDEFSTEDGQKIFQDRGIEIGKDLQVKFDISGSQENIIDNMSYANLVQQDIIRSLSSIEREVDDLQPHLNNVAFKDGKLNLVKDLKDYQNYIDAHPDLFPVDDPDTPYDEGYLSRAFTSKKMIGLGEGPVESRLESIQAARERATEGDIKTAYGFTSWEDNAVMLNSGHNYIQQADDTSVSKWGTAGDKRLNSAMGIGATGSKYMSFTAKEAESPKVVNDYKIQISKEAIRGFDFLTDDALFDGTINNKRLGDLMEKFESAETVETKNAITVALARALYEEITIDGNTPTEFRDTEFGIDLQKLRSLDVDFVRGLGKGIPATNKDSWDDFSKTRMGKILSRLEQVYKRTSVGIGNTLDPSNIYYEASLTGGPDIFRGASDDDPLKKVSNAKALNALDIFDNRTYEQVEDELYKMK